MVMLDQEKPNTACGDIVHTACVHDGEILVSACDSRTHTNSGACSIWRIWEQCCTIKLQRGTKIHNSIGSNLIEVAIIILPNALDVSFSHRECNCECVPKHICVPNIQRIIVARRPP